jgi:hypothetical protein
VATEIKLFEYTDLNVSDIFCGVGMKNEFYRRKVDAADELLASILDVAGCIKKREDQLRRTARDLRTRVEKCTEVGGGIWGKFIVSCNRVVI